METTNEEQKKQELLSQIEFERNEVLPGKKITNTSNRCIWRDTLNMSNEYKEILSLLHHGLDEDMYDDLGISFSDVIKLYFDYSYGYSNYSSFSSGTREDQNEIDIDHEGKKVSISRQSLRQKIAMKAFSVLCQKFLKDNTRGNDFKEAYNEPSWWPYLIDVKEYIILSKAIEFFSFIRNIPRRSTDNHSWKIAIDFLYKLSTNAWVCNFSDYRHTPKILAKNREHFIKILWGLDELDFLQKNWDLLSLEDIETMKKLANSIKDHNGPVSFKNALLGGNKMATCFYMINVLLRESRIFPKTLQEQIDSWS
ncbi:MAG: hypothetical protein Athens071416_26 [Parcubacteria group bacterium Athens0714_16]|nr:MAG: hypothetical protein Athens071416_26 [Parcubacteria group bacterium Athens0714_16]